MGKKIIATEPLFIGLARAANTGDEIPQSTYDRQAEANGWEDKVEFVDVDDANPDAAWNIDEMTVPQLKDYAKTRSIDLGGATKAEDIRKVIKAGGTGTPSTPTGTPSTPTSTPTS